jgi:hypothetical protein
MAQTCTSLVCFGAKRVVQRDNKVWPDSKVEHGARHQCNEVNNTWGKGCERGQLGLNTKDKRRQLGSNQVLKLASELGNRHSGGCGDLRQPERLLEVVPP